MSVNKNKRGSALIATLIVALITISIVGLFLRSIYQEINYAHRSRMAFEAVNLAESGLEYAILAIQENDWTGWTSGAKGYYRNSFSDVTNAQGNAETRAIQTFADMSGSVPKVISEGIIQGTGGQSVSRQIYIELGGIKSFFGNGVVAKEDLVFNGNGNLVDSYHSGNGKYGEMITDSGEKNITDAVTVATLSKSDDTFNLGNSNVFGKLATGGGTVVFGPNGSLTGVGTEAGTTIDYSRIVYDFSGFFPDPKAPTSIPSDHDTDDDMDGKADELTIGDSSSDDPTYVVLSKDWSQLSKQTLTVKGHVIIVAEGDMAVSGSIVLDTDYADEGGYPPKLEIHSKGSLSVSGNGIVNDSQKPERVILFGVGDPDNKKQEIKLSGNAALAAVVYAPSYDITLGGAGSTGVAYGAMVGSTVTFGGQYEFHYDEALADLDLGKKILQVTRWIELTDPAERRNVAGLLAVGL